MRSVVEMKKSKLAFNRLAQTEWQSGRSPETTRRHAAAAAEERRGVAWARPLRDVLQRGAPQGLAGGVMARPGRRRKLPVAILTVGWRLGIPFVGQRGSRMLRVGNKLNCAFCDRQPAGDRGWKTEKVDAVC